MQHTSPTVRKWATEHNNVYMARSNELLVFKANKPARVTLQSTPFCKKPSLENKLLELDRFYGIDTESFHHLADDGYWVAPSPLDDNQMPRYVGELKTDLITIAHTSPENDRIFETSSLKYPIEVVLDYLHVRHAVQDISPTKHNQKPVRKRKDGYDRRDGRANTIKPIVLIFHNLSYDIGRLMRNHKPFLRSIATSSEATYRFKVGKYEIECCQSIYTGTAPFFEWYVRYDGKIFRVMGRDLFGYLKNSLKEIGKDFFPNDPNLWKHDIETGTFNLPYEDIVLGATRDSILDRHNIDISEYEDGFKNFISTPKEKLWEYAQQDPRTTLRAYLQLMQLLIDISPASISRDGTIPASAPACAARIAYSFSSEEQWQLPPRWVSQLGSTTYCGAYVDSRKVQYIGNMRVRDQNSAYPFAMSQLPNPANSEYEELFPQKFTEKTFNYLKGQFGIVVFTGRGFDDRRPSTRTHDCENNRLVYQYGEIPMSFTTIQELLYGVATGRLEVDCIHSGCIIRDQGGESFLKKFISIMHKIKSENKDTNKPLALVAKLLMNSLYGKLLELRRDKTHFDGFTGMIEVPIFDFTHTVEDSGETKSVRVTTLDFIPKFQEIYIEHGSEGIEEYVQDMWNNETLSPHFELDECNEPTGIILKSLFEIGGDINWKAGKYYNPIFGACITGGIAARTNLFLWCTNGQQGDTDSGMYEFTSEEEEEKALRKFREIEKYCGYPSPTEGLGSWELELFDGQGWLIKNKVYFLEGTSPKKGHQVKMGLHSLSGMPKYADTTGKYKALEYLTELAETGETTYETKTSPETLKSYALRALNIPNEKEPDEIVEVTQRHKQLEPGIWFSEKRTIRLVQDPNQWVDETGERRWKRFKEQEWLRVQREHLQKTGNFYTGDGFKPTHATMLFEMRESKQPLDGCELS